MTDLTPTPVPTQVKRPWRATLRSAFQALVAFAGLAPLLAAAIEEATSVDLDGIPLVVTALLLCAAVTRVMALPAVEAFLQTFVPFLSAAPKQRILGKALAGDLPPTTEKPGGMRAATFRGDVTASRLDEIVTSPLREEVGGFVDGKDATPGWNVIPTGPEDGDPHR